MIGSTKKRLTWLPVAALLVPALILGSCGRDTSKADLDEPKVIGDVEPERYESRAPDQVIIFSNVDDHPTIVKLCIDGAGFMTISKTHSGLASPAVQRVPAWDEGC